MKFDKETIIVLAAAALLILGWYLIYPKFAPAPKPVQQTAVQPSAATNNTPAQPQTVTPTSTQTPAGTISETVPETVTKEPETVLLTLENQLVKITIDAKTGGITSVTLKSHQRNKNEKNEPIVLIPGAQTHATLSSNIGIGRILIALDSKVTDSEAFVERRYSDGLTITQTYTLAPDACKLLSEIKLASKAGQSLLIPKIVVWGAGLPPMHMLDGEEVKTERRNIDFCLEAGDKLENVDPDDDDEDFAKAMSAAPVKWIASTNKYFASIIFAEGPSFSGAEFSRALYPDKSKGYYEPSLGGVYTNIPVTADGTILKLAYYCGAKDMKSLSTLPASVSGAMHISYFSWFEILAKPMVKLLVWLHGFVGSYGWAIILLTVIVRLVFWPVTQKANNSMRKMQKIQPEMKALREKYKENPQELNTRMMELYKKEGVNPLGGCLPILLQLPVFFALYSALDSAVELRHVSFWWAVDLTKPDLIGPAFDVPLLGHVGLHPLIIMMTILMFIQQKMTPATGDPMQRRLMMSMPFIMLFMLYSLPSGLTLYWTVSQLFSIIQMKYGQIAAKRDEARESSKTLKQAK